MDLVNLINRITKNEVNRIGEDDKLGLRLMCPEYSLDRNDIKTFPMKEKNGVFVLCWKIEREGRLYACIKPAWPSFSYSCTFQDSDRTQLHTHDYIELTYVAEGEFCQNIMGREVRFRKGELCMIDKNCMHQDYLFQSNASLVFIGLANHILDEAMLELAGEEKILNFLKTALIKQKDLQQYLHFKPKKPEGTGMEECIGYLIQELEQRDTASVYICKGLIIRILDMLSRDYEFQLSGEQKKKMGWLVFEEVKGYMEEHYATIRVRDLMERFHFNEDYFNRLLKEKTGLTYSEYLQEIRLKEAESLLKSTDITIEEITDRIGYQNKGYFYKLFMKRFGETPASYRKRQKEYRSE